MSENKFYVFDDGSIASKLLRHEYKDAEVVKVNGSDNLVEQFTKFDNNNGRKIYLPFYVEQLAANNEQLRKDIQKVESLGFRNLLVLPLEGVDEKAINQMAKDAGIIENSQVLKGEQVNEKKESSNAGKANKQVQYLP